METAPRIYSEGHPLHQGKTTGIKRKNIGSIARKHPKFHPKRRRVSAIKIRSFRIQKKPQHLPSERCCGINYIISNQEKVSAYIMPPMPPIPGAPIGISGLSSFFSTITHSVVRNIPAIEAAFSRATRVTLAGSTTPAACRFS